MDSQFIWNAILTIGMGIISFLIALGARYLTQIQTALKERMDTQDVKIQQIRDEYKSDLCNVVGETDATRDDLHQFKVMAQREFVNREEYVRTTQSLDAKMDRILDGMGKIQVNVAKLAAAQEVKPQ